MSDLVPTMRAPLAFDTECQPFDTQGAVAWMLQRRSGGRPQTIRDEQKEDLFLSIAATRHDLRRVVNGRPGVYILTAVDEDGEEVDCPRAEVELAPLDVATGSESNAGQQNLSPTWMASVMEQLLESLTRHLVVSSDVSRSLAASMVDQQRACTESVRAMNETIGVASGLDALERQLPTPHVDVQELASLLAKNSPNDNRPEEKEAESWVSQILKSPVTPMVINGVAKPFVDLHQARMKKALMEAEAAQSPPVQPPAAVPPASSPPAQPPAPAEPESPEPVASAVDEIADVDDIDEREDLAGSDPDDEPKATCTCSSTTAGSPPAPEMMLVPLMGSSAPTVESVDAMLPWASGQAERASSLPDEPASDPQEQPTTDRDEQVDPGVADLDSPSTKSSPSTSQETAPIVRVHWAEDQNEPGESPRPEEPVPVESVQNSNVPSEQPGRGAPSDQRLELPEPVSVSWPEPALPPDHELPPCATEPATADVPEHQELGPPGPRDTKPKPGPKGNDTTG